eukprot:4111292-Alexandrium_andersonii.AAC.1
MAAQTVRLFLQHAHHQAMSAGVLFMDLKNAFYSVQRAYVFVRPNESTPLFFKKLEADGAQPQLIEGIAQALAEPTANQQAG